LSGQSVFVRATDKNADKQEFVLRTDENGKFEIALRPSTYSVEVPLFAKNPLYAHQTVVVQAEKISDVALQIDTPCARTKPRRKLQRRIKLRPSKMTEFVPREKYTHIQAYFSPDRC